MPQLRRLPARRALVRGLTPVFVLRQVRTLTIALVAGSEVLDG